MKQHSVKKLIQMARVELDMRVKEMVYFMVRGRDYKLLNEYILKINRLKDIDEILFEASNCLKDILNYELFAFAFHNTRALDIWVDPRYYQDSLFIEQIKMKMNCQEIDTNMHTFNKAESGMRQDDEATPFSPQFIGENTLAYAMNFGNESAMLYVMPGRSVLKHQQEIIEMLVKVLTVVLDNYLNRKRLEETAMLDPLTECFNRRILDDLLIREVARAERYGINLSVIMLDVDHFKMVNDTYGHQAGDFILRELSRLLKTTLRKSDYLVRYGGEEFIMILPEISIENTLLVSERLRQMIEEQRFMFGAQALQITSSFGISSFSSRKSAADMVREADEMLYHSKNTGRNRVSYREEVPEEATSLLQD